MGIGTVVVGSGDSADSMAAMRPWDSGSGSSETGAMPHLPNTQPPTRRPKVEDLRSIAVAVDVVLELSAEATDAESEVTLEPPVLDAAMEASRESEDFSGPLPRSAVTVGADMIGGVEIS